MPPRKWRRRVAWPAARSGSEEGDVHDIVSFQHRRKQECSGDFIDDKFGLSSVSIGDEATFAGDIRCSSLGFLTLAQIKASHELGERSRAQVAKAQNEHFVIVLLRAGKLKITQAGRECVLSPNMFTLFDATDPTRFIMSNRPRSSMSSCRPALCVRG